MSNVRSFTNPFEIVDRTNDINLVPNLWGKLREDGLFTEESVAQNTITFESTAGTIAVIPDQVRGARNNVSKDDNRIIKAFSLTHHPLDDYITPQDIAGKRAYGSDNVETKDAVMARKLARIRMNHAITLEAARWHTLTTGTQFNPGGTIGSLSFFTDFGVTQKSIDFVLGTAGTEVNEKAEEGISHIQTNIQSGEVASGFTVYCSPEFFGKLIKQAGVKEAYKYYASVQEPLRERQGSGLYRQFRHGGVTYIEVSGSYNGARHIPANEAVMVPTGTLDCFKTFFGPANKFDLVNTLGEQTYAWTYSDAKGEKIEIASESNFLNLLARPQVVVKCTTSN